MEEKEIVRKSVPIPKKWLKELLDFLGIEEDRYLAWILFPHECNDVLGFLFSEDRAKEMVRDGKVNIRGFCIIKKIKCKEGKHYFEFIDNRKK